MAPYPSQSHPLNLSVGGASSLANNYAAFSNPWTWPTSNGIQQPNPDGAQQSQAAQMLESRQSLILQQIQTLQQRALELRAEEHSLNAAMAAQAGHAGRDAAQPPASAMFANDLSAYPSNLAAMYQQQQGKPPHAHARADIALH